MLFVLKASVTEIFLFSFPSVFLLCNRELGTNAAGYLITEFPLSVLNYKTETKRETCVLGNKDWKTKIFVGLSFEMVVHKERLNKKISEQVVDLTISIIDYLRIGLIHK